MCLLIMEFIIAKVRKKIERCKFFLRGSQGLLREASVGSLGEKGLQVVEVEVIEDRGEEVVEFLAFLGGFGGVVGRQRGVEGDGGEGLLVGEAYVVAEL